MSTTKTITLSMESLNKLYFQFFERFVTPNLLKNVNEITQLLRNKTAYDVYKYLEELFLRNQNSQGYTSNQVINSLNSSVNNHSLPNSSLYQYALPTNVDHSKSAHNDHHKSYDKPHDKPLEDSMSFKNKLGIRRTLTGLAFEQPPKAFQYRNYSDQASQSPSIYTNPGMHSNDFKLDFPITSKEHLSLLPNLPPNLGKIEFEEGELKTKTMKDIVKKIGKLFNENHSKIEKYNKNSGEANKLFNINTSTRLEKKEESRKQYQFLTKPDMQVRKY